MLVADPPRACARCRRDTVNIHARSLCALCYRDHRDEYPRTKHQRPFTVRERDLIRRDWGQRSAKAIARELGRQVRDVYSAAVRFGATQPRRVLKTDAPLRRRLVQLHGRGLSDREIGGVVGIGHGTVARWLRRLGLPSNCRTRPTDPFPERTRLKQRAVKLRQIREEGLESAVAFLRKHAEGRAEAVRMGWPQAGTLLEARILDRLRTHGPQTADQIALGLAVGRSWLAQVVSDLRRRGLVARPGRVGRYLVYGLAGGVERSWPNPRRASV